MTIDRFSQHCPNPYFESRDGELLVGGETVTLLAARVGRTPFYAYDRAVMTRMGRELRQALPAAVELHYAIKANPMPEVVHHLAGLVDGLNVASAGELRIALGTGKDPTDISFAGPGKSVAELEAAVAAGIVINMESELEMRRIAAIATRTGSRVPSTSWYATGFVRWRVPRAVSTARRPSSTTCTLVAPSIVIRICEGSAPGCT